MTTRRDALTSAIARLRDVLAQPETDVSRDAAIQRFEFCFELAWKSIQERARDEGLDCQSPKSCLTLAFKAAWITNEREWLAMLADRNQTSHTYDEDLAKAVYGRLHRYRLPTLADELVHLKVDLLLTTSDVAALAAKNATKTIPVVFLGSGNPVTLGLVDSLARAGENITGITSIAEVLAGKRLEILKETLPKLFRVGVFWNPKAPESVQQWKESQTAARELGLQLHSMEVSGADKLESAFNEATKARSAAVAGTHASLFTTNRKRIVDLAAKSRLPAIYSREDYVDSGGLMSYGADRAEPYRRAAIMIDKILKGAKPADLPVEQPTKFELVINLKTAKALGLTIPPIVLMRAERVVK